MSSNKPMPRADWRQGSWASTPTSSAGMPSAALRPGKHHTHRNRAVTKAGHASSVAPHRKVARTVVRHLLRRAFSRAYASYSVASASETAPTRPSAMSVSATRVTGTTPRSRSTTYCCPSAPLGTTGLRRARHQHLQSLWRGDDVGGGCHRARGHPAAVCRAQEARDEGWCGE